MKNTKLFIVLALLLAVTISVEAAPQKYKGQLSIKALQLEQVGDSLLIAIDINAQGVNVDSRRSISIIPILVAPNMQKKLPEVTIKGYINYLTSRREMAMFTKAEQRLYEMNPPYAVVKGYKSNGIKNVAYRKTIAFEPWMKDARLDIQEDVCGCGVAPRSLSVACLVNNVQLEVPVEPYTVVPYLAYVQPMAEAIKRRELQTEAFLDFIVNRTDIRPDYMNNPRELKKLVDVVSQVSNDAAITVRGISVAGYASPEGSLRGNQLLSEGRAKALVNYLSFKFDYPKELYSVRFGGENWQGLKDTVTKSSMPYKNEVLAILNDAYITDDNRKIQLKKLFNGAPYNLMLKEFYPALRKAICKIDYVIKGFDLVEAQEVFKVRPQHLSLNEMYLVANTYQVGSQEFVDIFETAVRLYPNDMVANLNAASAAIARNDMPSAKKYLDRIEGKFENGEYYNTLGVYQMQNGLFDKARTSLTKAADLNIKQANSNLDELDRKVENLKLLTKQKNKLSK